MIQEVPLYSGPVKKACDIRPYGRAVTEALWRANGKPPVELVVADLELSSPTFEAFIKKAPN